MYTSYYSVEAQHNMYFVDQTINSTLSKCNSIVRSKKGDNNIIYTRTEVLHHVVRVILVSSKSNATVVRCDAI